MIRVRFGLVSDDIATPEQSTRALKQWTQECHCTYSWAATGTKSTYKSDCLSPAYLMLKGVLAPTLCVRHVFHFGDRHRKHVSCRARGIAAI